MSDPIVVWTTAATATLFTGDPIFGIALSTTVYYVLSYPMGDAVSASDAAVNWEHVTRMFYFATYGTGTALAFVWMYNLPTLVPSHPVDATPGLPVRRRFGLYTLMLSTVFLTQNILWLFGAYVPTGDLFGTISTGLPEEFVLALVSGFSVLSLLFIGLVHHHTLSGNTDSTLSLVYHGSESGQRDEGAAIIAYAWFLYALIAAQALWAVGSFPLYLRGLVVLTVEAVILTAAYILFRTSSRGVTRRLFSRKAGRSGIRWHQFVALLVAMIIGVGALYAGLVGTVITTFADIDWLLWGLFLGSTLFTKLYSV